MKRSRQTLVINIGSGNINHHIILTRKGENHNQEKGAHSSLSRCNRAGCGITPHIGAPAMQGTIVCESFGGCLR